jgi:dihydrofolate synthase/folylpolyglutamate synthase
LAAPVQQANAATAIAALRALDAAIPETAFAAGVAAATLPGRLQRFQHGSVEVVVDVGHNPQAARELNAWLQAQPGDGATRAVFAALSDKDVAGVVAAFEDRIRHWHLAGLEQAGPRGQSVETLAARLAGTAAADGERHADVGQALQAAIAASRPGERVLVFGSFHTVAEALVSLHSVL